MRRRSSCRAAAFKDSSTLGRGTVHFLVNHIWNSLNITGSLLPLICKRDKSAVEYKKAVVVVFSYDLLKRLKALFRLNISKRMLYNADFSFLVCVSVLHRVPFFRRCRVQLM